MKLSSEYKRIARANRKLVSRIKLGFAILVTLGAVSAFVTGQWVLGVAICGNLAVMSLGDDDDGDE